MESVHFQGTSTLRNIQVRSVISAWLDSACQPALELQEAIGVALAMSMSKASLSCSQGRPVESRDRLRRTQNAEWLQIWRHAWVCVKIGGPNNDGIPFGFSLNQGRL